MEKSNKAVPILEIGKLINSFSKKYPLIGIFFSHPVSGQATM
jgi:hypothetical protein